MKKLILFLTLFSLIGMSSFEQETGLLTGTLRDQLTNDPLFGVKVTAGGHVTRTDEAGVFSLALPQGSFDVRFNRYGLQTLDLQGVNVVAGDAVTVDTTLKPVPVPVSSVSAESMDGNSWLQISWSPSYPAISEMANDDGQMVDLFVYDEAGSQVAVKYAFNDSDHLIGGRIYTGDGTFPGTFLGTKFLVRIYDDKGMTGLPGNTIDEDTVIADQYGWVGFDSLDALISGDNFYMAMYQLNDTPNCAPVGYTDYPPNNQSMMKYQDYNWEPFNYGNAMIRPWVTTPHDSLRFVKFEVARVLIFGPGDTSYTLLLQTGNLYYNDYTWFALSDGCYLYAVKAIYNNGQSSDYTISNFVCHYDTYDVSIIMDQTGNSTPGLSDVKLTSQTQPFEEYSGISLCPGTAEFGSVMKGKYHIEIFKPGYEKFVLDSIDIYSDTTFEITLQETCYPVENLQVNPFTALLSWEANNISQFSWHCAAPGACHTLTTPELDLSTAEHWTLTVVYNYNSTVEPASVDYSIDHGRTWAPFYLLNPQPGWDTIDIDLSIFSFENGEQEIMFQVHDYQGQPYYLDLNEVKVWTPDLEPHPENCLISLNGEIAGSSDTTFYQLTSLVNGSSYHTGVYGVNCAGQTDTVFTDFTYRQLFPPLNLISYDENDSLFFKWSPPVGSWDGKPAHRNYPDALTGYILHFESTGISMHIEINDPLDTSFRLRKPTCDTSFVSVTAVYDLSDYGYPGESFESLPDGPLVLHGPGPITDEFIEDWSSMSFYMNCWDIEGNGMAVEANQGNPGPALIFRNIDHPYQSFLTSYPILIPQTSDGNLFLEFDLKLLSNGQSGHETLEFQAISEGSNDWVSVKGISNFYGNIDWMHFSVDLSGFVSADLFRFRLKFAGIGGETTNWTIDNIQVHNLCPGPQIMNAEKTSESAISLNWMMTEPKAETRGFAHYRIYRDYNDSEYQLLMETADTSYTDTLTYGGKYCYGVTALYDDQGILCESPVSDSACITSFLGIPDNSQKNRVVCYPNPAGEFIMIKSDDKIKSIELYNSLGMKIKTIEQAGSEYKMELNDLQYGIFLIRIDLKEEVYLKKIMHTN